MSLFQLVKKARRGFLTALPPPDILNVFKMPRLTKGLINQAFLRRLIRFEGAGGQAQVSAAISRSTASAQRSPSTAAEVMPPA